MAGWLAGWLAANGASGTPTCDNKNAYPQGERASNMGTFKQTLDVELTDAPRGVAAERSINAINLSNVRQNVVPFNQKVDARGW